MIQPAASKSTDQTEHPNLSPKEKRSLTDQQRKELIKLQNRLFDLSSRNRSIRLNRLDAKWTFDLNSLNLFGIEVANQLLQHCLRNQTPKAILPKPTNTTAEFHQKLSKSLTHLHRSITELKHENGLHDLYIGFPFLAGTPLGSEAIIQSPIFLLPVTLEKIVSKKEAPSWMLYSSKEMPVIFNKTLFFALSKLCNLTINQSLFEEEIPNELYGTTSFMQKTHELLTKYGILCEIATGMNNLEIDCLPEFTLKKLPDTFQTGSLKIRQYAILGHFPQSNSSVQSDYDKLLELDQDELDSIICFLSPEELLMQKDVAPTAPIDEFKNVDLQNDGDENQLSHKTIDDRKEADNFLLLPSDSSQDRILLELGKAKTLGMVVWGPPGTGKSQTIVNIIGDCLSRGKSVLLVSQKRAALDVVYDRLSAKKLTNLAGLVHDSKVDRKSLYEKIIQTSSQGRDVDGRPTSIPLDPSPEIERIRQTLKDVFRAYNDESCGVKLGELYRRLGRRKDALIPLDSCWKTTQLDDLSIIMAQLRSIQSLVRNESKSSLLNHRKSFQRIESHEIIELKEMLDRLTVSELLPEASAIIQIKENQTSPTGSAITISTPRLQKFSDAMTYYQSFSGFSCYLKPAFWRTYFHIKRHLAYASSQIQRHVSIAKKILPRILKDSVALQIADEIQSSRHDRVSLNEFSKTIFHNFNQLKGYDIEFDSLKPDVQKIVDLLKS